MIERLIRYYNTDYFESVNLHVKGKLDLCFKIGVVDLEESVDELFEINVAVTA